MNKSKKKILVVDDLPVILEEARKIMDVRYDLETASTGEEAFEKVKRFKPDLILMDIHMPDMEGIECMDRIHSLKGFEKLPVLITMNEASIITVARALEHGAADILQKPFIEINLIRKIEMQLKLAEIGWEFGDCTS